MFGIICVIICLVCQVLIGVLTFLDKRKGQDMMKVTPWTEKQSWFLYFSLLLILINYFYMILK